MAPKRKAQNELPMETAPKRERLTTSLYGKISDRISGAIGSVFNYILPTPPTPKAKGLRAPMPGAWPPSPIVAAAPAPTQVQATGRLLLEPKSRMRLDQRPSPSEVNDPDYNPHPDVPGFNSREWRAFWQSYHWGKQTPGAINPYTTNNFEAHTGKKLNRHPIESSKSTTSIKHELVENAHVALPTPKVETDPDYKLEINHLATSTLENVSQAIAPISSEFQLPTTPETKRTTAWDNAMEVDSDVDMMDAPSPQPVKKQVHWPSHSHLTSTLSEATFGSPKVFPPYHPAAATKVFFKAEPALKPPAELRQWRSPVRYDPDESILSPEPSNAHLDLSPQKIGDSEGTDIVEIDDILDLWCQSNAQTITYKDLKISESAAKIISDREEAEKKAWIEKMNKAREARLAEAAHKRQLSEERRIRLEAEEAREKEEALAAAAAKELAFQEGLQAAQKALNEEYEQMWLEEAQAARIKIDLSEEWDAKVNAAMSTPKPTQVLVKKNELTRHDFGTLLPQPGRDNASAWLNDQIVNTTMEMMVARLNEKAGHDMTSRTAPAPYWAFNSAWINTITGGNLRPGGRAEHADRKHPQGMPKFSRWAKKRGVNLGGQNLLKAEKICFPICFSSHWTMVVVNPQQKTIEYLDSFLASDRYGFGALVREWIEYEIGEDYYYSDWKDITNRSSRQFNGQDCGVFAIMNAFAVIRDGEPSSQFDQGCIPRLRRQVAATLLNGGFKNDFDFNYREKESKEIEEKRNNRIAELRARYDK
jgi:sentrin-specific protease 1